MPRNFGSFGGCLPPTSYNKLYQAQIPSPCGTHSRVMQTASREGEEHSSSGDRTGTHSNAPGYVPSSHKAQHPVPWLQPPASRAWRSPHSEVLSIPKHASSCILPGSTHPIQSDGAGVQRAKQSTGERGEGARREPSKPPCYRGDMGKVGVKET